MHNLSYLKKCLFFDIETVGRYENFDDFSKNEPEISKIWLEKASNHDRYKDDPEGSYEKFAGLHPEYGKIVCISIGYWDPVDEKWKIEHFDDENSSEKELLWEFCRRVNKDFDAFVPTGFNIKNFDIPYIYRRLLVNHILPPFNFDLCDKKPWEIKCYDLYKTWSDNNSIYGMCNFDLVCNLMGVPSPKQGNVIGASVSKEYYMGNIKEISLYCRRDVHASIKLAVSFAPEKLEDPSISELKEIEE